MDTPSDHTTSSHASPLSLSVDRIDLASLLIPQDTEEACQRWGAQLNRLYPSPKIFLYPNDPDNSEDLGDFDVYGGEWASERRSAAYGLFTQLQEVMRMCESESERARMCFNYTLAQAIVTPVHRLPEEILSDVFMIIKAHRNTFYSQSRYHFEVCRRWHRLSQHTPAFWSILRIRQWTDKDYVHSFLSRGKNKSLDVTIYTGGDSTTILNNTQPYEALALVVSSAERLDALTLKRSDNEMLGHLPTPLRNHLLGISATAKALKDLRILGDPYIFILSPPSHATIFSGLTHLDVSVSGRHEPVNFLPHLLVLRDLSLTRVALVDISANTPLPLVNTLISLSLYHTSIQWMVGKFFKRLTSCEIYFPHRHNSIRPMTVTLPLGEEFTYHAQPLAGLRGFVTPSLRLLHLKNKNCDKSQNVMEIQHIRNFLLPQMPLNVLILEVECNDQDLLGILRLLPNLTGLRLRLRQPQSLGWIFFAGLLANICSSEKDCGHWWCKLFGNFLGRQHITICPLLQIFTISYDRWLRGTEIGVVLPILPAIAESRRAAGGAIKRFTIKCADKPQLDVLETEKEYPELQVAYGAFQSAIQCHSIHLISHKPHTALYFSHRPFSTFLNYILELTVFMEDSWTFPDPLDLLRHCKGLKSLSLKGLPLQSYPMNKELHLVHTLSTMTLTETSLSWMSGRTFTLLKECRIIRPDQEECSKLFPVHLPVCTFLECQESPFGLLSKFRAPPPC